MLKSLTDWNTATSKVFVINHNCKLIEINNIVIDVIQNIHNTRGSGQNLIRLKVRSNRARKALNEIKGFISVLFV